MELLGLFAFLVIGEYANFIFWAYYLGLLTSLSEAR